MKRVLLAFLFCLSYSALAQTVSGVRQLGDKVLMNIDGRAYMAFTIAQAERMLKEGEEREDLKQRLAKAEEDLTKYRTLSDRFTQLMKDYAALNDKYKALTDDSLKLGEKFSEAAGKLVTLNNDYRKLVSDYDALAGKYRSIALRSAPRQPFDVGVGVVRAAETDHKVLMVGAGHEIIGDFGVRAWLFGGQSTYGVLLGVSF